MPQPAYRQRRTRHVNVVPLRKAFTGIMLAYVHLFCIGKLDIYLSKYSTGSIELTYMFVNVVKQTPGYANATLSVHASLTKATWITESTRFNGIRCIFIMLLFKINA